MALTLLDSINHQTSEDIIKTYMRSLVDRIEELHSRKQYHGDIKLENIEVVRGNRCQLRDFEFSGNFEPGKLRVCQRGSLHYASPEIMLAIPHSGWEPDIWALGIVMYALLTGYFPFGGDNIEEVTTAQINYRDGQQLEFPDNTSQDAVDLVYQLLTFDHTQRPSAGQVLESRWFSDL